MRLRRYGLRDEDGSVDRTNETDAAIEVRRLSPVQLRRARRAILREEVMQLCARKVRARLAPRRHDVRRRTWLADLQSLGANLEAVAAGEGIVPRRGARGLGRRTLLIGVFERLKLLPFKERADGSARFLSGEELAWLSLLIGNWPRIRVTANTTADDVVRAELEQIKTALKRHRTKPLESCWYEPTVESDGTTILSQRTATTRIRRGKKRVEVRLK